MRSVLDYTGSRGERRYAAWLEDVCRGFCRVDAEPAVADRINWKIDMTQVSALSFARVGGTSGRFLRSRDLLADGCDDFVLTTAISGDVLIVEGDNPTLLRESQMCLMDTSVECGVCLNEGDQFTSTRIPRRELLCICPHAEHMLFQPIAENQQARDLIIRYFDLSAATAGSLDAVGQQVVARHMIDLIALVLRTGRDETQLATQRGYAAARLQVVQRRVLENLGDNGLTVATIANRCGLSPKQVQRLFEHAGTTFTEFVLEQRLLLARRMLASAGNRQEKIGIIAYTAGFGDLSYFNRTFRERFDMTPSEWRNGQPADFSAI